MSFDQSEHTSELKKILDKRASLENKIERYASLFPSKVTEHCEKFGCSNEETSYILHISDYIITSTEIQGLSDEERIAALFESVLYGRDNCRIDVKSQITTIELCQQLILAIQRHFRYQKSRGFPLSAIKSQLISSWVRDFFDMLKNFHQVVDIRWIVAELEGSYFREYAKNRYVEIIKDFHLDKFNKENFYLTAEYFISRLNLEFDEEDEITISKSAFETQTHLSSAFLVTTLDNDVLIGSTLKTEFEYPKISSIMQQIYSSIPKIKTESGNATLRYYQTFMRKIPTGDGHRLFTIIEQNDDFEFLFVLITSNLDDLNYTSIRNMLKQYLVDASCLKVKSREQKIITLNHWVERILISQTVEGAEVFGLPHDVDREREWIVDSLLYARRLKGKENCAMLARKLHHEIVKVNTEKLVYLNGLLHDFIDQIFPDINYKYEIISFEAYHEAENDQDGILSIFHNESNKFAQINLQSLFSTSEGFVSRKNHIIKRKYSRMKVRELALSSGIDMETWAKNSVDFKDYGFGYFTLDMSVDLVEKQSGKVIEKEIVHSETSVSNKLRALEKKKDVQLDIQEIVYQYITETLTSYVKIAMLEDSKLKEFVSKEFKAKIIKEETRKIEEIIDRHSIRRLPDTFSERLLEIVTTIDNYFTRSSRDGLSKLHDFEVKLTNSELLELEVLYKAISKNV